MLTNALTNGTLL